MVEMELFVVIAYKINVSSFVRTQTNYPLEYQMVDTLIVI